MKVNARELIRKAALMTGETLPNLNADTDLETATLHDRLALELEMLASDSLLATPRRLITGWRPLKGYGMTRMEDGSVLLPLPDDFLRLGHLRLEGWERPVNDVCMPDSPSAALQSCRVEALRASPQRPVAVASPAADALAIRLYGGHVSPPSLAEGWYLPAPRIGDDGTLDLPAATIPLLLKAMAQSIA